MSNPVLTYRDKVRDAIRAGIPAFRNVKATAGKLTPDQIKKFAEDAPVAFVAITDLADTRRDSRGMIWGSVKLGILVVVRDRGPKLPAERQAWDFVCAITRLASCNQFDAAPVSPVTGYVIDNMMNDDMIDAGLGVIAVGWDVHLEIGRDHGLEALASAGWAPDVDRPDGWLMSPFPDDGELTIVGDGEGEEG